MWKKNTPAHGITLYQPDWADTIKNSHYGHEDKPFYHSFRHTVSCATHGGPTILAIQKEQLLETN